MKKGKKSAAVKKKSSALKKKTVKKPIKKTKKVLAIPKGYHSVTPYLIINNAANAIEFYKKVFGANVMMRMDQPNGKVGHAELKIGDAKIMVADECPEMNVRSPEKFGGSSVIIHVYIKNVDQVVDRAVSLGAKLVRPVENMFYGDRSGTLEDPHGHIWCVSTHIENVTPAQVKKRSAEMFKGK